MIFSGATGPQVTKFHDFSWSFISDTNSSPCSQSYPPGQTPIGSSTYPESIWYQDYRATMILSAATGPQVTKFHNFSWFFHSYTNSSTCSQSYPPGQTPIGSSTYPESIWYQDYRATMILIAATGPKVTKFHGFAYFFHSDTNFSPCSQSFPPGKTPIGSSIYQLSI